MKVTQKMSRHIKQIVVEMTELYNTAESRLKLQNENF
jgi:hypothetical protein